MMDSYTTDPQHIAHRDSNIGSGRPAGQQAFVMEYDGEESVRFDWLHIAFHSLAHLSEATGCEAILLEKEASGHYLCKLMEKPISELGPRG